MIILDLNGIGYDGPRNELLEKNIGDLHDAVVRDLKAKGTWTFAAEVAATEQAIRAKGFEVQVDPLLELQALFGDDMVVIGM